VEEGPCSSKVASNSQNYLRFRRFLEELKSGDTQHLWYVLRLIKRPAKKLAGVGLRQKELKHLLTSCILLSPLSVERQYSPSHQKRSHRKLLH